MLFTWTPDLINESLGTLTDKQRAALDCFLSLSKNQTKPGPVRMKKYGFTDLDDYDRTLASARETAMAHFAEPGIHHLSDLSFTEPNRSTEGRIQKAVQKAACAVAAA